MILSKLHLLEVLPIVHFNKIYLMSSVNSNPIKNVFSLHLNCIYYLNHTFRPDCTGNS